MTVRNRHQSFKGQHFIKASKEFLVHEQMTFLEFRIPRRLNRINKQTLCKCKKKKKKKIICR